MRLNVLLSSVQILGSLWTDSQSQEFSTQPTFWDIHMNVAKAYLYL
jgi:hypothetical protein